jgi:hypothetical protein
MGAKEERDEHNQQVWLARSARERQDLSLSVEEALDDPILQELFWSDEDDDTSGPDPEPPSKSIFPPRLSLQTRAVSTVDAERDAATPKQHTDTKHFTGSSDGEEERQHSPITGSTPTTTDTATNTNTLMRFAQRLTSSFATFDLPPELQYLPTERKNEENRMPPLAPSRAGHSIRETPKRQNDFTPGQKASSLAAIADIEVQTASTTDALPRMSMAERRQQLAEQAVHKKRLAGRGTRVRLEVVPKRSTGQPAHPSTRVSRPETSCIQTPVAQSPVPQTTTQVPIVFPTDPDLAQRPPLSPATFPEPPQQSVGCAGTLGADGVAYQGIIDAAARGALSGNGCFEDGQGEVTIANANVTERSVILITLTSNPGPVVVQYITLQPQVGFTVHLTAPTTMRASFNYIVLLGELF